MGLEYWLRYADELRSAGEGHAGSLQYEVAFVELLKAATIILERIPKLATFGPEPEHWADMLVPILTRFVEAFDAGITA